MSEREYGVCMCEFVRVASRLVKKRKVDFPCWLSVSALSGNKLISSAYASDCCCSLLFEHLLCLCQTPHTHTNTHTHTHAGHDSHLTFKRINQSVVTKPSKLCNSAANLHSVRTPQLREFLFGRITECFRRLQINSLQIRAQPRGRSDCEQKV